MVGKAGFEPATSCSQSRRANQAALLPVCVQPNKGRRGWESATPSGPPAGMDRLIPGLFLAEDPIHFRPTVRTRPLGGASTIGQFHLIALKVSLVATLHAVPVIRGHRYPPTGVLVHPTQEGLYPSSPCEVLVFPFMVSLLAIGLAHGKF